MKLLLYKTFCYSALMILLLTGVGCEEIVEPEVFSELTPKTTLTNEDAVTNLLNNSYRSLTIISEGRVYGSMEFQTDIAWETGGGANQWAVPFIHLRYDASTPNLWRMWFRRYEAIRDANLILENIENLKASESQKKLFKAEARFIRAASYTFLRRWFGPVPLRTNTEEPLELPRATQQEIRSFIEEELMAVIPDLPEFGNEPGYGRAHKSAARAFLTKYYLNTKQWQKTADMAKEIIDGGHFSLHPSYTDMFRMEYERNSEFIWVHQKGTDTKTNNMMNAAFPPQFKDYPPLDIKFTDKMRNWARQDRIMDDFADSFDPDDDRGELIIDWYLNMDGDSVSLRSLSDNQRSLKYYDPNAIGGHGTDIPEIRYADILLSRAEALNELTGPNQESIDLVNQVRNRAGLGDLSLGDYGSKEELRNHIIMKERGWEFYWEMKRRQDLIRIGNFIEVSQSLGTDRGNPNAEEFRVLLPIPQRAMDSNPELLQNSGY